MPVETAAPGTTPAGAPATTPGASDSFSSFLGVEAETLPSLQPRETPAPGGEEAEPDVAGEAEPGAGEGEESTETLEEIGTSEETQQAEEDETADDWLPTEQEKEFPLAILQKYAPRYGYTAEEIAADPRLQVVLKDKLNSDIYVEQLRQQAENPDFEETTPEETEETASDPAAAAADPRADYYKRVEAIAATVDPKATEELGRNLLAAFGVNTDVKKLEAMLADPKLTPEARQEVQSAVALVRNAGQVGTTLAKGAIDLILTSLPEVLPQVMEAVAPGLLGAYQGWAEVNTASRAWSEVAQAKNQQNQPLYSNLPNYGTKEFAALTVRAEKQLGLAKGALGEMASRGFIREAYTMVAQVASGQRVSPQAVSRAVSVGRQQERNQQQRRATGRALGAGQQSRQFGQEESTDPVRDALRQQIMEQNTASDPFRGATPRA